ncbi:MAG: phosphatidylserine decarboxylase [bacterium]|nr:phosphatidylserine decarboxylase [bacterium]
MSRATGWLADRHVPGPLRGLVYKGYSRFTGANIGEARGPLDIYPSLGAFFVRTLVEGARPIEQDQDLFVSPVDGAVQATSPVQAGTILQAKGRSYPVRELLAGVGADVELEGGQAWTLYLGPKDYHRIHSPETGRISEVTWVPGTRYSVAPGVLARRTVLPINERCALRLDTERGPLLLVLVGALNVGRIRVVGVQPNASGPLSTPRAVQRGEEIARFEMGSTVVVIAPPGGPRPSAMAVPGTPVRLGRPIGRYPE